MSSSSALKRTLVQVGKVSLNHVRESNRGTGDMWLAAIDVAQQKVIQDHPSVTGMEIAGAAAHQSHNVKTHSNVLSVKFYSEEQRVVSGHIHINGRIDYSRERRKAKKSSGSNQGWQPIREEVDFQTWTIYDPEKKKNRKVMQDGDWLYIEKGGIKVWF
ncbi:hypothetical protein VTK73DRAFT_8262 [Phialemonium thermophilum]|uniref:Uncharacterized protein n=1 Tax=Phialemonium thermophilum TaxID=223376 RepID=A0ABR3XQZ9_9PEZI